ncbi:MAG: FeoB-associated Cys-rich membrane protein [Coriobacteriales bacterium]|nr:FeoB-associated Cys-rich membrane protein [Coriobacteriales bacterium]
MFNLNTADIVIVAIVAAALVLALRHIWRNRKRSGCDGCGSDDNCAACNPEDAKNPKN